MNGMLPRLFVLNPRKARMASPVVLNQPCYKTKFRGRRCSLDLPHPPINSVSRPAG